MSRSLETAMMSMMPVQPRYANFPIQLSIRPQAGCNLVQCLSAWHWCCAGELQHVDIHRSRGSGAK